MNRAESGRAACPPTRRVRNHTPVTQTFFLTLLFAWASGWPKPCINSDGSPIEVVEGLMEALIDFAAVSGAIVFSMGVALSLEWFALNTLMKMMPVQQPAMVAEEAASD